MIYRHIDDVKISAHFSKDKKFRYRLDVVREVESIKGKTACVVMQNPSYANEARADKSVQFMEKVVFEKRFPAFTDVDRLIVVNQFAYIQTNDFKGLTGQIGDKNDASIMDAFKESDIIILAWGKSNSFYDRQNFVLNLLKNTSNKQLFKTSSHPSRGKYDGFILPFDIK